MRFSELTKNATVRRVDIESIEYPDDPYGAFHEELSAMKSLMVQGDEVYWFESCQLDWESGMGAEEYVLVRDDEIIAEIVLRMN